MGLCSGFSDKLIFGVFISPFGFLLCSVESTSDRVSYFVVGFRKGFSNRVSGVGNFFFCSFGGFGSTALCIGKNFLGAAVRGEGDIRSSGSWSGGGGGSILRAVEDMFSAKEEEEEN